MRGDSELLKPAGNYQLAPAATLVASWALGYTFECVFELIDSNVSLLIPLSPEFGENNSFSTVSSLQCHDCHSCKASLEWAPPILLTSFKQLIASIKCLSACVPMMVPAVFTGPWFLQLLLFTIVTVLFLCQNPYLTGPSGWKRSEESCMVPGGSFRHLSILFTLNSVLSKMMFTKCHRKVGPSIC